MKLRLDFPQGSEESITLFKGAKVALEQTFSTIIMVWIGTEIQKQLLSPIPGRGRSAKLKVARISSWVEVSVAILAPKEHDKSHGWTKVLTLTGGPPLCYSIPRVNLDIQSLIDFSKVKNRGFSFPSEPPSGNITSSLLISQSRSLWDTFSSI